MADSFSETSVDHLVRQAAAAFATAAGDDLVLTVAEAFAPEPRLALEPGWYFGIDEVDTDPRTTIRREIWRRFVGRPPSRSITLPWLERLRLALTLGNDLSRCLYVGGRFEPNELLLWKTLLRPGHVFVDAGANEGVYTVLAADAVGSEGLVFAVEPSSRELARLEANVRLNGLSNVVPARCALSHAQGVGILSVAEPEHAGQNALGGLLPNPRVAVESTESVVVTTLDDLIAEHDLRRLDGVKLDVEGCEGAAIQGARLAIDRFHPILQLEVQPAALELQGGTTESLLASLAEHDYRIYVFDRKTGQLREPRATEELRLNVVAAPDSWRPPTLAEHPIPLSTHHGDEGPD